MRKRTWLAAGGSLLAAAAGLLGGSGVASASTASPVVGYTYINDNTAGTNTSDNTVENTRPPMTASAIGERNSPPAPKASALGIMPAAIATVEFGYFDLAP